MSPHVHLVPTGEGGPDDKTLLVACLHLLHPLHLLHTAPMPPTMRIIHRIPLPTRSHTRLSLHLARHPTCVIPTCHLADVGARQTLNAGHGQRLR